jgi:hypothetical protein
LPLGRFCPTAIVFPSFLGFPSRFVIGIIDRFGNILLIEASLIPRSHGEIGSYDGFGELGHEGKILGCFGVDGVCRLLDRRTLDETKGDGLTRGEAFATSGQEHIHAAFARWHVAVTVAVTVAVNALALIGVGVGVGVGADVGRHRVDGYII